MKPVIFITQAVVLTMSLTMVQAREHPEKADIFSNQHPVFSEHPGRGKGLKKGFYKYKEHKKYKKHHEDHRHNEDYYEGRRDDFYRDRERYRDKKYDRYKQRYYEELYGMERRRYYDPRDAIRAPVDAVIDNTVNKIHRSIEEMRDKAINGVDSATRRR